MVTLVAIRHRRAPEPQALLGWPDADRADASVAALREAGVAALAEG